MKRTIDILCLILIVATQSAWAERADKGKPVNIDSNSAHMDDARKLAIYEGHVVLSEGTLLIKADRIEVHQDEQGFASGNASGSPVYFREKMENSDEYAEGWADRLEYDGRANKIKLVGQARLKRGEDDLRGNLITYDQNTEFFQAQGSISGKPGRVHAVIRPKNETSIVKVKP